jgi:Mg2+ and Co2+ transporters
MMTLYHWEGGGLKEVQDLTGSCWINLADPSTEEIDRVHTLTGIPREFITDPLDKDERTRLENDEGITQLIVHVPYHEPHENVITFHTIPLCIVLTETNVVTICNRQTPVTSTFLDQIRRVCSPEDQFRFVF